MIEEDLQVNGSGRKVAAINVLADTVGPTTGRLVIGGRPMGGRIASQIVAQRTTVDGLALFAYPVHSPAKPSKWRDGHLPSLSVPTPFCSGTRDAFATPE